MGSSSNPSAGNEGTTVPYEYQNQFASLNLNYSGNLHSATVLQDGNVLLLGGTTGTATDIAELYDPNTGAVTTLPTKMLTPRVGHTATLLDDGTVIIIGGRNADSDILATAELYNPTSGEFTAVSSLLQIGRTVHTATLLNNGKVLITGGTTFTVRTGLVVTASVEFYDVKTSTFSAPKFTVMPSPRSNHTATLLQDGRVLLTGGYDAIVDQDVDTALLFLPNTDKFSVITNTMTGVRSEHSATLMADGRVLLVGGFQPQSEIVIIPLATENAEYFDPSAMSFSLLPNKMTTAHAGHSAALLPNGRVLMSGGRIFYRLSAAFPDIFSNPGAQTSMELFK